MDYVKALGKVAWTEKKPYPIAETCVFSDCCIPTGKTTLFSSQKHPLPVEVSVVGYLSHITAAELLFLDSLRHRSAEVSPRPLGESLVALVL